MTELLTAAQMRAIEAAAIASGEVTGLELMERAGQGVVEAIFEEWPELGRTGGGAAPEPPGYFSNEETGARRAVVLCGPGNNGGDGFVVARLLKEHGWDVEVFLYGDPERLPPDARVNYERWLGMGAVEAFTADVWWQRELPGPVDLVVDALFGTGLTRPVNLPLEAVRAEPEVGQTYQVVAVDIPSGFCADSGREIGREVVCADLTVTFHEAKRGHVLGDGPTGCGRIIVKDIGLKPVPRAALDRIDGTVAVLQHPPVAPEKDFVLYPPLPWKHLAAEHRRRIEDSLSALPVRLTSGDAAMSSGKSPGRHKYSHGHALILSGPCGKGGAARLAARGALRIGAGLVTVGCPPEALLENAARLDAVMLRPVADAAALAEVLEDPRITALCLGPGLGLDERARGLLAVALQSRCEPRPPGPVGRGSHRLVLDADALTILSQSPDLFAALHEGCVLTPHAGEFARLFPGISEKLAAPATKGPAYSKVDATREAAKRAGCVVLFKGPDTVIADPSGRAAINSAHYERAAPWLATAGSGDVLAGFITGLLARGFAPMQAAETAAWLHVECGRKFGPGLISEDLPEQLPAVFRDLGL